MSKEDNAVRGRTFGQSGTADQEPDESSRSRGRAPSHREQLTERRCKFYTGLEARLLRVLAVLGLLKNVVDDLRHVSGQVVERCDHLGSVGL